MVIQCKYCAGLTFDCYYICKKCGAFFCKNCGKKSKEICRECRGDLRYICMP